MPSNIVDQIMDGSDLEQSPILSVMAECGHDPREAVKRIARSCKRIQPPAKGPVHNYIPSKQTGPNLAQIDGNLLERCLSSPATLNDEERERAEKAIFSLPYETARSVILLRIFRWTSRMVVAELLTAILSSFKAGNLLQLYLSSRAFLEKAGNNKLIDLELAEHFSSGTPDTNGINEMGQFLIGLDRIVSGRDRATRFNWHKLIENQSIRLSKVESPKPSSGLGKYEAKDLLKGIDKLAKEVVGARNVYEFLCEFVHPNVGQSQIYVLQDLARPGRYGLKHRRRVYGSGEDKDSWRVLSGPNQELLQLLAEVSEHVEVMGERADTYLRRSSRLSKSYVKSYLRQYGPLFRGSDECPCGSSNTVNKCCGKKLRNRLSSN